MSNVGVGTRIGPYEILRKIGVGGMGSVYEAVHEAIERRVAIKLLHPESARSPEVATRFLNEARAVNRVAHPAMVQISDLGQLPDGTAYLVMELLVGEALNTRLRRMNGRLPLSQVLDLGAQIADALAAAHAKGIVHRDLKPENIMIVADPVAPRGERIKVLDFGIAKLVESNTIPGDSTKSNLLMGTPRYMSPEQCRGAGKVDAKADVYSLGILLYQMLAGQLPFDSNAPGELIVMHITEAPPPLQNAAPDTPPQLVRLVELLLTKAPAGRPSMGDVAVQLTQILRQLEGPPSAALPILTAPPPGAQGSGEAHIPATVPMQSLRSHRAQQSSSVEGSKSDPPHVHSPLPMPAPHGAPPSREVPFVTPPRPPLESASEPMAVTITAGSSTLGQSLGQSVSQPVGLERRRRRRLYAVPAIGLLFVAVIVAQQTLSAPPKPARPATMVLPTPPRPKPPKPAPTEEETAPANPDATASRPPAGGKKPAAPAALPSKKPAAPPAAGAKPVKPATAPAKNPQRKPKVEKSLFDNID